jgi:hypothetical protein
MKDHKAIEWLSDQLPGLVDSGVLTPETADALRAHYKKIEPERTRNLAVVVCSILGATLIGAGVILLIAHNWDDLGRPMRTVISFLSLTVACLISALAIVRKPASMAINEGAGIFHVLSIGAAISLVSQTYHISGNFSDFLLIWSLLALPLVYLLRSTSVGMLYVLGITAWAGSRVGDNAGMLWYWPMLAALLPFYTRLLRQNRCSISATWLSMAIGVALPIALGAQCNNIPGRIGFLPFSGYFAVLYLIEKLWFRKHWSSRFMHPFRFIGAGGIMALSVAVVLWPDHYDPSPSVITATYLTAVGLSCGLVAAAVILLIFCWRNKTDFNVFAAIYPLAALAAYFLYLFKQDTAITIVMNFYAVLLAIGTIVRGFTRNRLAMINAGMVMAVALGFHCIDMPYMIWLLLLSGYLAVLYLFERQRFQKNWPLRSKFPLRAIGAGGITILSIVMSYREFWQDHYYQNNPSITKDTYLTAIALNYGLVAAAVLLLILCRRNKTAFNVVAALFPVAVFAAYLLCQHEEYTAIIILMNSYAALLAIGTIIRGLKTSRLGTLNVGMVIAAALIVARFFDDDLGFVARGLVFILIGTGFLATNWILVKKREGALA